MKSRFLIIVFVFIQLNALFTQNFYNNIILDYLPYSYTTLYSKIFEKNILEKTEKKIKQLNIYEREIIYLGYSEYNYSDSSLMNLKMDSFKLVEEIHFNKEGFVTKYKTDYGETQYRQQKDTLYIFNESFNNNMYENPKDTLIIFLKKGLITEVGQIGDDYYWKFIYKKNKLKKLVIYSDELFEGKHETKFRYSKKNACTYITIDSPEYKKLYVYCDSLIVETRETDKISGLTTIFTHTYNNKNKIDYTLISECNKKKPTLKSRVFFSYDKKNRLIGNYMLSDDYFCNKKYYYNNRGNIVFMIERTIKLNPPYIHNSNINVYIYKCLYDYWE